MRWGERKLTEVCKDHLQIVPEIGDAFLFFNRKRDTLKLFYRDEMGSSELSKLMPKGGFILPAPMESEMFVKISPKLVPRVFGR
jgi:hypothetical protein